MAAAAPGTELFSTVAPLTQAASPLVTPWFSTDGYLKVVLAYVFTSGTTVISVEGSGDAVTLDSTCPYGAVGASPQTIPVMHRYIRFRVVQTVLDATVTSVFVKTSN